MTFERSRNIPKVDTNLEELSGDYVRTFALSADLQGTLGASACVEGDGPVPFRLGGVDLRVATHWRVEECALPRIGP